jgi:hypothetical protein
MVNGPEADAAMVRVRCAVAAWAGLLESVTVNVSVAALAAAVGVPLIAPAFRARPAGSVPLVKAHV